MNETTTVRELTVELPDSAPQVRITAGLGSAGQKTWNLRRPVTLLGSRRPAHIVLHDKDISAAHCVVINTGRDVLLKDLHTSAGTYCNKARITIHLLKDGDVVTIGGTAIQFAIQNPANANDDSGCGIKYVDPTRFAEPISLQLVHTDRVWSIEESAALIGRHEAAELHLDHDDISARHALLFRFEDSPAIFDLGGRTGIWVNGQRTSLTPLADGDRATVGPFGLTVNCAAKNLPALTANLPTVPIAPNAAAFVPADSIPKLEPSVAQPAPIAEATNELQAQIHHTWEGLNSWESRLRADASALGEQQTHLTRREAELEARDAALRGKLHDVERFNEQVLAREREVAAAAAKMQADLDDVAARLKTCEEREQDLARRQDDAQRRENALTQRWTRLQATTCAKCGTRISLNANQAAPVA